MTSIITEKGARMGAADLSKAANQAKDLTFGFEAEIAFSEYNQDAYEKYEKKLMLVMEYSDLTVSDYVDEVLSRYSVEEILDDYDLEPRYGWVKAEDWELARDYAIKYWLNDDERAIYAMPAATQKEAYQKIDAILTYMDEADEAAEYEPLPYDELKPALDRMVYDLFVRKLDIPDEDFNTNEFVYDRTGDVVAIIDIDTAEVTDYFIIDTSVGSDYAAWAELSAAEAVRNGEGDALEAAKVVEYANEHGTFIATVNTVTDVFESHLGVSITRFDSYHADEKDNKEWYTEPDSTISPSGIELVSPALPLARGIAYLEKTLDMVSSLKALETNSSTGLHINLGVPDPQNIDLMKLLLLLGNNYVAAQFDRTSNRYARDRLNAYKEMLIKGIASKGLSQAIADMNKLILADAQHFDAVNLSNLMDKGYIEFRAVGGEQYETQFDTVKAAVLRMARAIVLASDPNAERQAYLTKLGKIAATSSQSPNSQTFKSQPPIAAVKKFMEVVGSCLDIPKSDHIKEFKKIFANEQSLFNTISAITKKDFNDIDNDGGKEFMTSAMLIFKLLPYDSSKLEQILWNWV